MGHNPQPTTDTSPSKGRPLSIDFSMFNPKNSMIYSLLPSAVQSRLPRLGSIRKTICTYGLDFEMDEDERRVEKTPSEEYSSEIVLRESTSETTEYTSYFEPQSELGEYKPAGASSRQQIPELESGIDWKFANQGSNLLSLSMEESATISQNPKYGNVPFARQLYIHGLTYLLRGLPSDLTAAEQLSIHGCIPRTLLNAGDIDARGELSVYSRTQSNTIHPRPTPSFLHKILASTIVQLFLLFQFLLPYLKFLLRSAYEYERTHHMSEKVLASSIEIVDAVGKQSLSITVALYGMGNGKVGQVLSEAASWFIEGITGGIHDGIGEGLDIIGVKKQT